MIWIDKIAEFCKSTLSGALADDIGMAQENDRPVANSNEVWSFEPYLESEKPMHPLTPKQLGDRLLQITKERAMRRIQDKEHGSHYSH